jgi:F-type H+-transporting ATPase subunit delta
LIGKVVARRYATALFKVGMEDGLVEKYIQEIETFVNLLESSKELKVCLTNPLFEKQLRQQILSNVLDKMALSDVAKRFLTLVSEKGRLAYLKDMLEFYGLLLDDYKGVARADLFSAISLSKEAVEKIKARLKEVTGKQEVILNIKEDPSLIGGIVAKIGDVVYDGSIRTQLGVLKERLRRGEV